jgi:excisionase family DNA binding protein
MRILGKVAEEEYITISKACNYAGVSREEIYKAISKGKLKSNNPLGNSQPDKVCKKSLKETFAKNIKEKNCKKLGLVQAAKFLKISRIEFYKLIKNGVLKTTEEGFDSEIDLSDIKDYLEKVSSPKKKDQS